MYLFLINPTAGNRRFQHLERPLRRLLDKLKIEYRFVTIDNLADIPALLEQHLRPTDTGVVVVGGNATVTAVINAMVGIDLPLAIVPMSKTNFLAKSLGITGWGQAIKMLVDPLLQAERLGKIGKHYFIRQITISSRQNLLSKYLSQSNPWFRFLGVTSPNSTGDEGVLAEMVLDDELRAVAKAHRVEVKLNGTQGKKKLQIRLLVPKDRATHSTTILHSDVLSITSDKKMPITIGNETIAYTPMEIRGMTKHINLVVPKPRSHKLTKTEAV
ncbi:MAG: diacylglycerol kinase family protein [bacterium]